MRRDRQGSPSRKRFTLLLCLIWLCSAPVIGATVDTKQIRFNGDFRYRIERFDTDGDELDPRKRHRIRARFGLQANIADEARFVFQLASGSDDLVSSNQTLSGAFSSKNIVLDLAYFEFEPISLDRRVTTIAGKSVLPFFRPGQTELLWDSNLRPEGLSSFFDVYPGNLDIRVLCGWYILEERESDNNSNLLAGQLTATLDNMVGWFEMGPGGRASFVVGSVQLPPTGKGRGLWNVHRLKFSWRRNGRQGPRTGS